MHAGPPGAVTETFVVGAIGSFDAALLDRMGNGEDLPLAERGSGFEIRHRTPLRRWHSSSGSGWLWAAFDIRAQPTSARTARDEAGAVGVAVSENGEASLHADHIGGWPVYVMRRDGAAYFSNRLDPVMRIVDHPTLDRVAWASLLSTRSIPPGRSPVREIATLKLGESLVCDPTEGAVSSRIDVPPLESADTASYADIIDAIGDALEGRGAIDLLLSGGLDSRLLLAIASHRRLPGTGLTTNSGEGDDREEATARRAARLTGTPCIDVSTAGSNWLSDFLDMVERVDYATTHHAWAVPLARVAEARGNCVTSGPGGGVLLNDHLQHRAADSGGSSTKTRAVLAKRLGLSVLDLDGHASEPLRSESERLEHEFLEATEPYASRHGWQALSILATRSARAIIPFVTRMVGPEAPIALPYLTPRVMRLCLVDNVHHRRSDSLHRAISATLDAGVARLETSRELPPPSSPGAVARRSPAVVRGVVDLIASDDEAIATLAQELQQLVIQRDIQRMTAALASPSIETVVHGALMVAAFRARYPSASGLVG